MISVSFLTAGRAIFTVSNGKGQHYTYRVTKSRTPGRAPAYFVGVLTGSNNEGDYTYLGLLACDERAYFLRRTAKSPASLIDGKPGAVFAWAMKVVSGLRDLPEGYRIDHAGKCGRCARTLTDPESIERGIGPECVRLMTGVAA